MDLTYTINLTRFLPAGKGVRKSVPWNPNNCLYTVSSSCFAVGFKTEFSSAALWMPTAANSLIVIDR
jgi:hypothetical protein